VRPLQAFFAADLWLDFEHGAMNAPAAMVDANSVNVLGVAVSPINMGLALEQITRAVANRQKGYICVTGVHGVSEAQTDPEFRRILNRAFLCTPDGMPLVWVGRWQGQTQMDRVYGPDLMLAVMAVSEKTGWRHFFFGGADGTAQLLRSKLLERFPKLQIAGVNEPPFRPLNPDEQQKLREEIRAARPDIMWVGLSTPKQERFMAQYLEQLDVTLMFGVGAAFDFHAGKIRQAPKWMQRSGLEWCFRLGCEPRRLWKRYLKNNPLFVARIFCQFTGLRKFPLRD
jgi:N-acetylglucosaminyldiphosphoundecaprenol N-acetyl-beta-D-mannosaminyltransferase